MDAEHRDSNSPSSLVEGLKHLARDVAEREGCQLYDLEFLDGRTRFLRVYITRPNGGVGIDDCANVSRGLNLRLDVEDLIQGGAYDLEVSTPGLERHLKETWHFEQEIGETIKVKLSEPLTPPSTAPKGFGPIRQLQGVLKAASDKDLVVEQEGFEWQVPRSLITKANKVFVTEKQNKLSPSKGKKKSKKR
ncbi:MAG: ribosome maturation factor RimP [Bdellovibrionales bacterium]|nr:ribosome maturation factor RimP [Bdellovibrionales bacterium]